MHEEEALSTLCQRLGIFPEELGIIVVDHGSRREASNLALLEVVRAFRDATCYRLIEPAHMEIAEPSIDAAFRRLVELGAKMVVIHPFFLLPGRHWAEDIPALAKAAAKSSGTPYLVSAPLGVHPLMPEIMDDRIVRCLQHVLLGTASCELCDSVGRCHAGWQAPPPP